MGGNKGARGAGTSSDTEKKTAVKRDSGRVGMVGPRGSVGRISVKVDESANEVAQQSPKEISDWIRY